MSVLFPELEQEPCSVQVPNCALSLQLGEQLAQLVPASGVDVVELEDEGTCVRFSPLMTSAGNTHSSQPLGMLASAVEWYNNLLG